MFENGQQMHFLTHYLNTSVFSSLPQSQFSTLISRAISNYYSSAATVIFLTAVVVSRRLKIDREQIHNYLGG
ncbi:MAG: hypothetical protein ACI80L_001058 [Pseudohongiellaceae bacterium]|jgi:hypothetical protein